MESIEFQHATVLDGSGGEAFDACVSIVDGRIDQISEGPIGADRDVDATGLYLAPGFIDMHAHSELRLFEFPETAAKTTQGITLEVLGQDGVSVAPVRTDMKDEWANRVQSLLGRRETWEWSSVAEFLDYLDDAYPAVNCAYYAPHGNLRSTQAAFENRELSADELVAVRVELDRAIDEGAFGMSTGMIYPPSAYGRDEELRVLAAALAEHGSFMVSHVWNEADLVVESIDRFIRICEDSGCDPHVSHLKVAGEDNWGRSTDVLGVLDEANNRGTRVTFDQYPYTAGSTMLSAVLPPWAQVGESADILERLRDGDVRERIRNDIDEGIEGWENLAGAAGTWESIFITRTASSTDAGRTIADLATEWDVTPVDAVCDLLVRENLDVTMADFVMSENDIEPFLADDRGTVCTDGIFGGKPHPRAIGTFPRVLERYVRERNVLDLPTAVYKLAGRPADVLGLPDRGRVYEGYVADLVLFDLDSVRENATYEDSMLLSDGMNLVLVGGVPIVEDGKPTGERPGQVLRSIEEWEWDGSARPNLFDR